MSTRLRPAIPAFVILLLWAGAVWYPQRNSIADDRSATQDADAEQTALAGELAELRESSSRLDELDVELLAFREAIPEEPSVGPFARHIDGVAREAGVELDLLSPTLLANDQTIEAGESLPPGVSSISISVGGTATYEAFMAFIDELLASDRLIVLDTLTLTAPEDDSGELTLDLSLRIFTTAEIVEQDPTQLFEAELDIDLVADADADDASTDRDEDAS